MPGAQSVTAGQAVSFNVTANDPESGQTLSLTASNLPAGAAFTQTAGTSSGQFIWTPAGTQTGSYIVGFTVADNGTPALSETKTVTINILNRTPALAVPGPQTTRVGQLLSFTVTATDPDQGQTLRISANLPTGATLTSTAGSAQFSWTPSSAQIGSHTINFTVADNGSPSATSTAAVRVDVKPTLTELNFTTASVSENGVVTRYAGRPTQQYEEDLGRGIKLEMVLIPGGRFQMGSPTTEPRRQGIEGPTRQVTVGAFAMGKYEVTQAQWRAVMGTNPSFFTGENLPVEQVTWEEAREFCRRLNTLLGLSSANGYRLPSEAEWEYSARTVTDTPFSFGLTISAEIANYFGTLPYGNAPAGILRNRTVNVGSLNVANSWGLNEMNGNVAEWCEDDYHSSYVGAPEDGRPWVDPVRGSNRITRGGGWSDEAVLCRSASRGRSAPGNRFYALGFRLARTVPFVIELPNRTPILTVPAAQTVVAGQPLAFTVTANDVDPGQTLNLTATSLPAGSVFSQSSPTSGQFTWTPSTAQVGTFTVSFNVTDSGLSPLVETRTVTITVVQPNRAPVLTVPTAQTAIPGQAVAFTVTASDPDSGQTLTLTTGSLPPGATFNPSNGQFAWTPTGTQTGSYTISFTATDNGSPVLSDTRTVTITVANRAPTLTVPGAQTVPALQVLAFTVTGSDPDTGQALTLTASNLPTGAAFNQANGQFSWTPTTGQAGSYTVTFTVTDNGTPAQSETRTVAITVIQLNRAPVLTVPGAQTVNPGQALTFSVTASDPDSGQTTTLTTGSLPAGATFNQANGQLTWTPTGTQTGSYTISFTATDSGSPALSDTKAVTVTVANRAPTLTAPGAQTVTAGQPLTFTVTGADPDSGQTLALTVSNLPTGATFNQASGQFNWTPTTGQVGSYTVSFIVTDNGTPTLSETRTVAITVTQPNRAPVLTVPGAQTVIPGQALTFSVTASDPDSGQTTTLTTGSLPAGAIFNQANGQLSWTPTGAQTGSYTVSFTVTDNGTPALSDTRTVTITVVNRAPTLTVPGDRVVAPGQTLAFTVTASDPDTGQTPILTASNLPIGAAFNQANGQFTWTPTGTQTGSYTVSFTVTDGGSPALSATRTVMILVVNLAPVVTVPGPQTILSGQPLTFTVTASDPDSGQTVTLSAANLPTGASFNPANGQFIWTPIPAQTGSFTVSFTATDNGTPSLSQTRTVTITVTQINRAPVLTVPGAQTATVGQALSFAVTATDPDAGQILTISATGLPTGATFTSTGGSGQFGWTPTTAQLGNYSITFTVSDNGSPASSASGIVAITVLPALTTLNFTTATVNENGVVTRFAGRPTRQYAEDLGGGVSLEMVVIAGGSFLMAVNGANKLRGYNGTAWWAVYPCTNAMRAGACYCGAVSSHTGAAAANSEWATVAGGYCRAIQSHTGAAAANSEWATVA
ncbi:MAG: tandem-95 repeat protein, partial [Acidobacteria bacterium]|nr:tandem-95 repeat protein [Acidobacteriota bacterium]